MNPTNYINTQQHCNVNSESGLFAASDLTCSSFTPIEPARLSVECGESWVRWRLTCMRWCRVAGEADEAGEGGVGAEQAV